MVDMGNSGTVDFFLRAVGGGATHISGWFFCDFDCTQDRIYILLVDRASILLNISVYFPYLSPLGI